MRRSTIATTFPSDDEWAEIDRRARIAQRLHVLARRTALFLAGSVLLFCLLWFFATNAQPRSYDVWSETCSGWLRKHT